MHNLNYQQAITISLLLWQWHQKETHSGTLWRSLHQEFELCATTWSKNRIDEDTRRILWKRSQNQKIGWSPFFQETGELKRFNFGFIR